MGRDVFMMFKPPKNDGFECCYDTKGHSHKWNVRYDSILTFLM